MKQSRCPQYVGVACVDGTCPAADREEYEERGIPVTKGCRDCFYYEGCEDCALYNTEHCYNQDDGQNKRDTKKTVNRLEKIQACKKRKKL